MFFLLRILSATAMPRTGWTHAAQARGTILAPRPPRVKFIVLLFFLCPYATFKIWFIIIGGKMSFSHRPSEDDASSGPERNGRHFLWRLDQLRGCPQADSKLNNVM
jgi:hypothetical protein